jgi:hypothetical protein
MYVKKNVKMVSCDSFEYKPPGKEPEGGRDGGDGRKNEWKLSEVNTRSKPSHDAIFTVCSHTFILF